MFCVPKSVQTSQKKIFFASGAGKATFQSELEIGIGAIDVKLNSELIHAKKKIRTLKLGKQLK